MKNIFKKGDVKIFEKVVRSADAAIFESGEVHPFYSTFALARDAEWSSRLFVLEMMEIDEEGIGTNLSIKHISPALVGDFVVFLASVKEVFKNSIICTISVQVNDRVIAEVETGQKIIKKIKLEELHKQLVNKESGKKENTRK